MPQVYRQVTFPTRRLLLCDAYCSAPPIESSIRPPRLSRDAEAVRPRAPLRPVKREVRESDTGSVEFVVDKADDVDVKVEAVKIEKDPHQLCVRLAPVLHLSRSSDHSCLNSQRTSLAFCYSYRYWSIRPLRFDSLLL